MSRYALRFLEEAKLKARGAFEWYASKSSQAADGFRALLPEDGGLRIIPA